VRLLRWRRRRPEHHLDFGAEGERLAARTLRRAGHRILRRNYRCPAGEIDLSVGSALVAVGANLALNLALVGPFGESGIAVATAVTAFGQTSYLYFVLRRRMPARRDHRATSTVAKTTAASLVMGAAVGAVSFGTDWPDAWKLGVGLTLGVIVFAAAARLLRIPELGALLHRERIT